jgi:hypothetical protein
MMGARGASSGHHLEVRVDKKAKTPKKPKTAKPKTKTA